MMRAGWLAADKKEPIPPRRSGSNSGDAVGFVRKSVLAENHSCTLSASTHAFSVAVLAKNVN